MAECRRVQARRECKRIVGMTLAVPFPLKPEEASAAAQLLSRPCQLDRLGLTPTEFEMLLAVAVHQPATIKEIRKHLAMTTADATRTVIEMARGAGRRQPLLIQQMDERDRIRRASLSHVGGGRLISALRAAGLI